MGAGLGIQRVHRMANLTSESPSITDIRASEKSEVSYVQVNELSMAGQVWFLIKLAKVTCYCTLAPIV